MGTFVAWVVKCFLLLHYLKTRMCFYYLVLVGMKVELGTQVGVVDGTFGTSGKVKIRFSEDLEFEETDSKNLKSTRLVLKYKKYTFSNKKVKIFQ